MSPVAARCFLHIGSFVVRFSLSAVLLAFVRSALGAQGGLDLAVIVAGVVVAVVGFGVPITDVFIPLDVCAGCTAATAWIGAHPGAFFTLTIVLTAAWAIPLWCFVFAPMVRLGAELADAADADAPAPPTAAELAAADAIHGARMNRIAQRIGSVIALVIVAMILIDHGPQLGILTGLMTLGGFVAAVAMWRWA
jgi:hypothetical protein